MHHVDGNRKREGVALKHPCHVDPYRQPMAHTQDNVLTDAVFHAPMFALNANAPWNACKPSRTRSTPTEPACFGADTCAP